MLTDRWGSGVISSTKLYFFLSICFHRNHANIYLLEMEMNMNNELALGRKYEDTFNYQLALSRIFFISCTRASYGLRASHPEILTRDEGTAPK
jgi:hypothetical protein